MERSFALYDSDAFYTTRFMEYFKQRKDFAFEILAFTRKESLEEYLQSHNIEILLLGKGIAPEDLSQYHIKYIYRLADNPGNEIDAGYPAVHKYQAAQAVMADILADYRRRENVPRASSNLNQMSIISVFSPAQGAEALSLAWSIGFQLSEQKKTLLVLLELLPVHFLAAADNKASPLTEFIYYLKENTDSIVKMNALLSYSGNLSCLSGVTHGADILALGKEDIHKWVEELKTRTDYQAVVFYLGCYTEAGVEIMVLSDTVLINGSDTAYKKALSTEWIRQMERAGIDMKQEKFIKAVFQRGPSIEHLPVTLSELMLTSSWNYVKQNLNSF